MTNIDYPYTMDALGRTATCDRDTHIRNLIEQVLFTIPGERVCNPTFGSGLQQLVHAPNSPELASTTQFLVQGALHKYLGHLIQVNSVEVESHDNVLSVLIDYTTIQDKYDHREVFNREV